MLNDRESTLGVIGQVFPGTDVHILWRRHFAFLPIVFFGPTCKTTIPQLPQRVHRTTVSSNVPKVTVRDSAALISSAVTE